MRNGALAAAAILGIALVGEARAEPLVCSGPFARDSSHERLAKEFGTRNVSFRTVDGPEGEALKATVIYPDDETRRVEVFWWDEKGRRRPSNIRTSGTGWTAPGNLRVGMGLPEVETANGKPFALSGFGWDYGGAASDWKGGTLAKVPGGCMLSVTFTHDEAAPEKELNAVTGDKTVMSNNRNVRAVKATVIEISVGYPDAGR